MDYSMVEALQEIQIVKRMIASSDYVGARVKLLEVRCHFPALRDISAMITVCDILGSAGFGFLGYGTDWYRVLQVMPAVNESDINFQYRKFTTLLEPIKNNFPGTTSALEIVQDAFSVLSNPEKRSVFDSKRAASLGAYEYVNWQETHDVDLGQGHFLSEHFIQKKDISPETIVRTKDTGSSEDIPAERIIDVGAGVLREREVKPEEISTLTRVTRGIHVLDEQREEICAQEASNMISPVNFDCSSQKLFWSLNSMTGKSYDRDFYDFDDIRKAEVFAVGQVWAAYDEEGMPRSYAWINNIDKLPFRLNISWLKPAPVMAHEKRWCEVGLPTACGFFDLDRTRATVTEPAIFSHMISRFAGPTNKQVEIYPKKHEIWAIYKDWKPFEWSSDPEARKGYIFQMVDILTGYSKQADIMVAGLVKVEGFKSVFRRYTKNGSEQAFPVPARELFMFSHSVPAYRFVGGEINGISEGMFELDPLVVPEVLHCMMTKSLEEGSSSESFVFAHCPPSPLLDSYPKAESLKLKWSVKDFASDQLWAVYDGLDSMPRRYAVVNNVVSGSEVCVTFLEPHPLLDVEIYWVEEKLPFVCGSFRACKTTHNLETSHFSHLVKCEQVTDRSFYRIYPKKGEIWAVYKNWNSRWEQDHFSYYQCRIVEIVTDFSDESGLIMASLVEVPGCTTFFQRQLCDGFELMRTVSKIEMLSFSHQITAFTIPGIEIYGIPEGSWHLEPDALPPNFGL
ncbi:hypothetical protein L1049_001994 [Liquidambar formosana]|uniref:J domain-containing protein n=1 Tax=Liquidambar formosana TaxID=63359 RepID=A0AAP0NG93_LIQFO